MKVEINAMGEMTVMAETPLESFALRMWADKNVNVNTPNLTVSWSDSNYPKDK